MNNATKKEVEVFLSGFKVKASVFDIVFKDERGKNFNALQELDITPKEREKYLLSLETEDYYQGPLDEDWHGTKAMWTFGKVINNVEVYIKICVVEETGRTICISFHPAEYRITYPLRS